MNLQSDAAVRSLDALKRQLIAATTAIRELQTLVRIGAVSDQTAALR